jgi:glycosyltransferase involved in cell wall biosynthesis
VASSRRMSGRRSGAERSAPTALRPVPLTVVVPTRDEERSLPACLASVVGWAADVVVYDSFSTDRTVEIARSFGARVVQRPFDDFATHKNWALDNVPMAAEWVFFLDADERFTPSLRDEVARVVSADGGGREGFHVGRRNHLMGRWVRHGGWYPNWNLRLFRRGRGRYESRIVHEHVIVDGRTGFLRADLLHEDVKGLERYFDRHNRYSSMEAVEAFRLFGGTSGDRIGAHLLRRGPAQRRWLKETAYAHLPGRPLWKFLWMYVVRLGFLDGRVGFRNCVLQMFYEYQISLKLAELRTDAESPLRTYLARPSETRAADGDALPGEAPGAV